MKREGFQHGMVRTFRIQPTPLDPGPTGRLLDERDSPATARFFTLVSTKPTNHSRYTGKCRRPRCTRCHTHPVSKARGKAKGTQKLNSFDVVHNHRLNNFGLSATAISDRLLDSFGGEEDYTDEVDEEGEEPVDIYNCRGDDVGNSENNSDVDAAAADNDDDKLSFCNVVLDLDKVIEEDEDWCLVADM